jgi:membrane-associated PAP2 superfamily phosphatase
LTTVAAPNGGDLRVTGGLLAALLAWDFTGADLPVTRWFADAHGFAARDSAWASTLLHSGGRWLAWAIAVALLIVAVRTPRRVRGGPDRSERVAWLSVMLVCALAVPFIKHYSATSCPWDLAEFGGAARYLSHWSLRRADGGSGHCFPSGHAVAAFAFLGMYFQWRAHDRARARAWLLAVLGAGLLFGIGQLARGAHYPSHTFWSAWICWTICVGADRIRRGLRVTPPPLAIASRHPG